MLKFYLCFIQFIQIISFLNANVLNFILIKIYLRLNFIYVKYDINTIKINLTLNITFLRIL